MSDSENEHQHPEAENDAPKRRSAPRMAQPAADVGDSPEATPVSDESAADEAATSSVRLTGEAGEPEPEPETASADTAATENAPVAGDTADADEAALVGVGAQGTEAPSAASASSATGARRRRAENHPKRGPMRPAGPAPLGQFAIVETGGKQYRVSVGDSIAVEKLDGDAGAAVTLDRVLLVGGDGTTQVGAPTVDGAIVSATIASQYRGEKIVVFKFKAKKRYRRRTGHRQSLTKLSITGISA